MRPPAGRNICPLERTLRSLAARFREGRSREGRAATGLAPGGAPGSRKGGPPVGLDSGGERRYLSAVPGIGRSDSDPHEDFVRPRVRRALSAPVHKYGNVSRYAARRRGMGASSSFLIKAARSARVNCHTKGLAMLW